MSGSGLTLFGSGRRSDVLLLIALLEGGHASEMARMLGVGVVTVQRICRALEDEHVIVSRLVGRARLFHLNPRYPACKELRSLLLKLAPLSNIVAVAATERRRPRKHGKEI